MFKELKLSKNFTIFTSTITNIDNSLLVKDLEYNCDISKKTVNHEESPGIQSKIVIVSKNIEDIRNEILKRVISHFKLKKNYLISYEDWVYISENTNRQSNYHNHLGGGNNKLIKEPPQWSIVYYAEMPNNLEGDDGFLYFLTDDGDEVSVLPIESQLIMFPSNVHHKPQLNKKSTNKRIVYATNITILDRSKKYVKKTKTLL